MTYENKKILHFHIACESDWKLFMFENFTDKSCYQDKFVQAKSDVLKDRASYQSVILFDSRTCLGHNYDT